jgi:hypothetical protein
MPQCPKCRYRFRVMDDEDDGQHSCPSCGYGDYRCDYCGRYECGDPESGPDCAEYQEYLVDESENLEGE